MKNQKLLMIMRGSQILNCIKQNLLSRKRPSSNGQYSLFCIGTFHMVNLQGVELIL